MNGSTYGGAPGPGATTTQTFKEVLASTDLQAKLPGGVLLKSGFGVVAKGRVLGKITASSKYAPYAATTVKTNASTGDTTVELTDASAFIVGDMVVVGSDAAKAITAINYTTNVITLASALGANQNAGVAVKTNDGRETAVCILDNDQDTTDSDIGASAWIAGIFTQANCKGVDSAAKTALKLCYFV
jgi:predicted RecA/RadA family phage recombinase